MSDKDHCIEPDCGKRLRNRSQTLLDVPGSVQRGGRGFCYTHWRAHCDDGTIEQFPVLPAAGGGHPTPVVTPERQAFNVSTTVSYFQRRRRRTGQPEGDGTLARCKPLQGLL